MKKQNVPVVAFFVSLAFLSSQASAQTDPTATYFEGKWSILVKGTPSGNSKMVVLFEKQDGFLGGMVQDTVGVEIGKIDKVEKGVQPNTLTFYFNSHGFDVNVDLIKKDEEHVTGSLMGMFDAEGVRLKK